MRKRPLPKPSITALWESAGGRVRSTYGEWAKATCPFHNDRTPSATVNEDEGAWRCFVCDLKGDAIAFIMHWQNMDFGEAVEYAREFDPESVTSGTSSTGGGNLHGTAGRGNSLVPSRKGDRRNGRKWTAPWLRR